MSQENVEIVKQVYEHVARRDPKGSFAHYADDIVWDLSRGIPFAPGPYHGHDGVREAVRDMEAAFASFDFEIEETTDADDWVLATIWESHVGRGSGVKVARRHYALWKLSNGKVTELRVYLDAAEALEAAGLSE